MAISNSDTSYAIIAETVPGTLPTTGILQPVNYVPGTMPTYESDMMANDTLSPSRAALASNKNNFRTTGGWKFVWQRGTAVELLMASALSGAWVESGTTGVNGDVLKAGNTDSFFSIEKIQKDGANKYYQRFTGVTVQKFCVTIDASGNADATVDLLGFGARTTAIAASALTYAAGTASAPLDNTDVTSVTIAGLSGIQVASLDFSVEHSRETQMMVGSPNSRGIGTSGARTVKLTVKMYRADFTPETVLLGDTPVAVAFTIGIVGTGYTVQLPAATFSIPKDEEDGSKAYVTVEFTGSIDATSGTDLIITRL